MAHGLTASARQVAPMDHGVTVMCLDRKQPQTTQGTTETKVRFSDKNKTKHTLETGSRTVVKVSHAFSYVVNIYIYILGM